MAEPTTDNQATSSGTETDGHNLRQAQLTTENLNALEANRQGIEADSANGDSAYGESTTSSFLTSIASEVTKGLYENGRRYAYALHYCQTCFNTLSGTTPSVLLNMASQMMNQKVRL